MTVGMRLKWNLLQMLWTNLVEKHGVPLQKGFDMSTVVCVSEGYSAGGLEQVRLLASLCFPESWHQRAHKDVMWMTQCIHRQRGQMIWKRVLCCRWS